MIYKSKQTSNYTVVPNNVFDDLKSGLSVGILTYLLSRPRDWVTYKRQLYSHFSEGRISIDKAFKELENMGYIVGVQSIDKDGKFSGYEWVVYDTPVLPDRLLESEQSEENHRLLENRQSENRQSEIEQLLNKEILSKEYTKEKNAIISFDEFWKLYGKKSDKKKCYEKFKRLADKELEKIKLNLPNYIKSTPDIRFRKNPLTWLNGECWEDEINSNQQGSIQLEVLAVTKEGEEITDPLVLHVYKQMGKI